jgi:hypothetical protein
MMKPFKTFSYHQLDNFGNLAAALFVSIYLKGEGFMELFRVFSDSFSQKFDTIPEKLSSRQSIHPSSRSLELL